MIDEIDFHLPPKIEDEVMYLYLLSKTPNHQIEKAREHKLLFLTKYRGYLNNDMVFYSKFTRQQKGPVAQHIYDIRRKFNQSKLITLSATHRIDRDAEIAKWTAHAEYIFDQIENIFIEYEWAFAYLDSVWNDIKDFSGTTFQLAQKFVYPLSYKGTTIEKLPIPTPLDFSIKKSGKALEFSQDWVETILLLENPNFKTQMEDMLEDLNSGHILPYQ
jgi:hypothetical protein